MVPNKHPLPTCRFHENYFFLSGLMNRFHKKTSLSNVDSIYEDLTTCSLNNAEECQSDGGFAGPGPPHDPHLLAWLNVTADPVQHKVQVGPVPDSKIHQSDGAMLWP